MNREEFLQSATAAAKKVSAESGLPAGVTVAQAALESRWGASELAERAKNYFGIKAHGQHAWMEFPTREVLHGTAQTVSAKFAWYASMEQCFECRDRLIATGALYADTRAVARDPRKFIAALAKHWATDPAYAQKLLKVYEESGLRELDSVA